MRVWDIDPEKLCDNHLLGEHREIHAIWSILTEDKEGYKNHPETQRWEGKLKALFNRHEEVIREMKERGFNESSPLDESKATGSEKQDEYIDPPEDQRKILENKDCICLH